MKVAVGIIGLVLSMIVLLQSCAVTELSSLGGQRDMAQAGSLGVMTAALMFLGGAFTFGLPRVARVLFVLGFLASIPARQEFPDMWVWGVASGALAFLLLFAKSEKPAPALPVSPAVRWDGTPERAPMSPQLPPWSRPVTPHPPVATSGGQPVAVSPASNGSTTVAPAGTATVVLGHDVRKWQVLKEVDADVAAAASRVAVLGAGFEAQLAERYLTLNDKTYLSAIEQKVTEWARREAGQAQEREARVKEEAARLEAEKLVLSRKEMESYQALVDANGGRDPLLNLPVAAVEPYASGSHDSMLGGIKVRLRDGDWLLRKGRAWMRFGSDARL